MMVRFTLLTGNETVLLQVSDFAKGLGCTPDSPRGRELCVEMPGAGDMLLELLSYVGLTATKAGIPPEEPLCRVTYWHRGAVAEVTLGLRLAEFGLERAGSTPSVQT